MSSKVIEYIKSVNEFMKDTSNSERYERMLALSDTHEDIWSSNDNSPWLWAYRLGAFRWQSPNPEEVVLRLSREFPKQWEEFTGGKTKLAGFFVGKAKSMWPEDIQRALLQHVK